jgi:hypothetical protein
MGTYDLIDAYLARLRAETTWHADGDAIVDEMRDHLLSAAEALSAEGADENEAQHLALAQFGPADEVAHALARGPHGAAAVPTRATVSGATVALAGSGLWVLYAITNFSMVHLYDRANDNGDPDSSSPLQLLLILPWALSLLTSLTMFFVVGMILKERHGGFGWTGRFGLAALALAIPAGLMGWVLAGWATLLAVGAALLSVELVRAGITPRAPAIGLAAGPALGISVWALLRLVELGSRDQYGNYPVATLAGMAVGCAGLAAGLYGIGDWLRNEDPIELDDPSHLVPT